MKKPYLSFALIALFLSASPVSFAKGGGGGGGMGSSGMGQGKMTGDQQMLHKKVRAKKQEKTRDRSQTRDQTGN